MKKDNKGFTLMEMLIVVAIIAILVAIAIPVFTTVLEKSREAADLANIRSAYAEVLVAVLDDNESGFTHEAITLQQKKADWNGVKDANATLNKLGTAHGVPADGGGTCTVKYEDDQKVHFYFEGAPATGPKKYINGDSRRAVMTGLAEALKDSFSEIAELGYGDKVKAWLPAMNPTFADFGGEQIAVRELMTNSLLNKVAYQDSSYKNHTWSEYLEEKGVNTDVLKDVNTPGGSSVYLDENYQPIAVGYFVGDSNGAYRYVYLDDGTTVDVTKGQYAQGRQYFAYKKDYAKEHGTIVENDK